MDKLQVADLIEQIPQELTPDEFLVALATKAAKWEREQCAKVCEGLTGRSYEFDMGRLHSAQAIRARNGQRLLS